MFIFWLAFEGTRKLLYRKDLPCPYCGFDPTWYRRDVRVARKKVEEFLKENPQISQYQFRATESTKSHDLLP